MNQLLLIFLALFCLTLRIDAQLKDNSECKIAREKAQKSNSPLKLIPNCEPSGEFSALQCHHNSKFCQCWKPDGTPVSQPSRKTKACECILQKHVAENVNINGRPVPPPVGKFIPQCNINGTFQNKQCHGSTGMCWCVDQKGNQKGQKVRGALTCT